ncbi:MAG: hypothetical protein HYS43_01105 [Candidatus Liptonbacteria bacterium]|nr:hypothetical protein [Candidatus Liptonbacteria bacterium]
MKVRVALAVCVAFGGVLFASAARAATNVDPTYLYAWNDSAGWINHYGSNAVTVTASKIEGYATSSIGEISFDCATTSAGNVCGSSNYAVTNDGVGNLKGWAWNDTIGWISFWCGNVNPGDCASSDYEVTIDLSRYFNDYAWNDVIGWISYNCADGGLCGSSDYKVRSAWAYAAASGTLVSSVFDTQITGGSAINSVLWEGTQPSGASVNFQIASSNCSNGATNDPTCSTGTWAYIGPDGTTATYYQPSGPDVAVSINLAHHNNKRYFRYRAYLQTDIAQTAGPTVTRVIINWSP